MEVFYPLSLTLSPGEREEKGAMFSLLLLLGFLLPYQCFHVPAKFGKKLLFALFKLCLVDAQGGAADPPLMVDFEELHDLFGRDAWT